MTDRPFRRDLLAAGTLDAARLMLGVFLIRGSGPERRVARIVEVEAYVGDDDMASHAHLGRTKRNAVMFGPPGVAYVYLVYGMYHCLNIVTEASGRPAALLIRAVEPVEGEAEIRLARIRSAQARPNRNATADADRTRRQIEGLPASRLASGPGLVCAAFSIDRSDNGIDMCDGNSDLRIEAAPPGDRSFTVATGPRIGIGYAPEPWLSQPWRYFVADSAAVSGRGRNVTGRPEAAE
ncbi:MAG TPA: DNA-3-methyladenine glycosylase [Candidatus Limnocylindrales bacterium]